MIDTYLASRSEKRGQFSLLSQSIKDASVLRRLEFAASFYPKSMPKYWENLVLFSTKDKEDRNSITPELAHQIIENLDIVDSRCFASDVELTKEIVTMKKVGSDAPLGVVLISDKESCQNCGSKLYLRSDRTSKVTIYDDRMGTLPGTHFTKYCRKRGCSFQQHYGYYCQGDTTDMRYNHDWSSLPFFLSTRETAVSMDMLYRLDKEILIGQVSYNQRADIFNDIHGYTGMIERR